ncbi:DUF4160 domain-containing protein [Mesorhizobium sp.]|nr:DUF4160 domain-containing protein [Mesorhizobium sp.]
MFDGIKIQVFADHNPPHFHAVKAEFEVLISIGSWEILQARCAGVISMRSWTGKDARNGASQSVETYQWITRSSRKDVRFLGLRPPPLLTIVEFA